MLIFTLTLAISCDNNDYKTTFTVTFDTDGGSNVNAIDVLEGEKIKAPTNPTKEGYKFAEWQLDGKTFDFNTPITKNITLKAKWLEIKHVKNLSEVNNNNADFGFKPEVSQKADAITIDGKDAYYIVDEWQDLWFRGDVTIRNIEFAKGVSFYGQGTFNKKIIIEDCIIKWCNQQELIEKYEKDNNFPFGNSGNGLCLSIVGFDNSTQNIDAEVRNCTLIGDNNREAPRKDSFPSVDEYKKYKSDKDNYTGYQGRGMGIGLGTGPGNALAFASVLIEGCSFEGLKNAAVQLFTFNCPITISNCDFKSWGINKDDLAQEYTYAIRGNVGDKDHRDKASLTIKNCTFDPNKPEKKCLIDNLEPTIE